MSKGQKLTSTFLCFFAVFAGVRFLDAYSANYEYCAQVWKSRIERAGFDPVMSEYIKHQMENQAISGLAGQACPALWPSHRRRLEAQLSSTE